MRRCAVVALFAIASARPASAGEIWLSILEPRAGSSAVGDVEVVAEVLASQDIAEVEFTVDGRLAGVLTAPPFRLPVDLGTENVGHRISVVARDTAGFEATDTVETVPFPITGEIKVELQQLYVTATHDGRHVDDLAPGDFDIFDDGERQDIVTFSTGDVPFTAVLLIDASESMTGHRIDAARVGAATFIDGMAGLDQASVMVFSDQLLGWTPFTDSRPLLSACLGAVTARGGTALNDHLFAAIKLLEHRQGRRVVILLSDGVDTHSVLTVDDVAEKAHHGQAMVYWIRLRRHLGRLPAEEGLNISSSWRSPRDYRNQMVLLEEIVAASGGRIIGVDSAEEIHSVFVEVLDELRQQYAIGYYPSLAADDGRWHDVRVKIRRSGVQARTHAGYVDH